MSHIDVHEIKLNLRYPNSRQEDITDAFMRGYQEALKIGHDSGRSFKAEKTALEARIDDLCAEVERSKAEFKKMDVWHSQELKAAMDENDKLRELAKHMHTCLTRPKVYGGEQPYLTATECPYFTEGACDYNACGFERRMRELGIEGACAKS